MRVDLMGRAMPIALNGTMSVEEFITAFDVPKNQQAELQEFWAKVQAEAAAVPVGQYIAVPND